MNKSVHVYLRFSHPTRVALLHRFGFEPINVKLFTFIYGSHIIPGIPPIGGISGIGVGDSGISETVASVVKSKDATEVAF